MDDLLLKDYEPRSTIVTEAHVVERPRYPAVDAHNHLGYRTDSFGYERGGEVPDVDVGALVDVMNQAGVRAMAKITGRWGAVLERQAGGGERLALGLVKDGGAGRGEREAAGLEPDQEDVVEGAIGRREPLEHLDPALGRGPASTREPGPRPSAAP
jgi:hypothetical protein